MGKFDEMTKEELVEFANRMSAVQEGLDSAKTDTAPFLTTVGEKEELAILGNADIVDDDEKELTFYLAGELVTRKVPKLTTHKKTMLKAYAMEYLTFFNIIKNELEDVMGNMEKLKDIGGTEEEKNLAVAMVHNNFALKLLWAENENGETYFNNCVKMMKNALLTDEEVELVEPLDLAILGGELLYSYPDLVKEHDSFLLSKALLEEVRQKAQEK